MKFFTIPSIFFLLACANSTPSDAPTVAYLQDLSESTKEHYENIIRDYGTNDCRYSSPKVQDFWKETDKDLRVLGARIEVTNKSLVSDFKNLKSSYARYEEFEKVIEQEGSRLPTGEVSFCTDPTAAMQQSMNLSNALDLLAQSITP